MSEQYPIQEDENFIAKIPTMIVKYSILTILSLLVTWYVIVIFMTSLHDPIVSHLYMSLFPLIISIVLSLFLIYNIIISMGQTYVLTTKRLYIRKSADSYISITKADIKDLTRKVISTDITLNSHERLKLHISVKNHDVIVNHFQ